MSLIGIPQHARPASRVGLLGLAVLFLASPPAHTETLASSSYRLEEAELRPAADAILSNASETLHIKGAVLGQVAAGRSTGPSGISLQGGILPVPVPEPWVGPLLFTGTLALVVLGRRPVLRSAETRSILVQEC